jgi:hypothetical protein
MLDIINNYELYKNNEITHAEMHDIVEQCKIESPQILNHVLLLSILENVKNNDLDFVKFLIEFGSDNVDQYLEHQTNLEIIKYCVDNVKSVNLETIASEAMVNAYDTYAYLIRKGIT